MMRPVLSGAIWTTHEAWKAGSLTSPCCPRCGAPNADLWHLFWQCPVYEHHRIAVRELGVDPSELPRFLALHGVAPEVVLGMELCAPADWQEAQGELLEALPRDFVTLPGEMRTLRMLGMIMRGACPGFQPQLPPPAPGSVGQGVDVYTDGS
eukprot:15448570-Alexandrium_andersonii.AAC.1